jgi:hypothetical protein
VNAQQHKSQSLLRLVNYAAAAFKEIAAVTLVGTQANSVANVAYSFMVQKHLGESAPLEVDGVLPRCHVCGGAMQVSEYKCASCRCTSGVVGAGLVQPHACVFCCRFPCKCLKAPSPYSFWDCKACNNPFAFTAKQGYPVPMACPYCGSTTQIKFKEEFPA